MKRTFISGASRGIGFALASRLSDEGQRLLLHASTDEGISRLKDHFGTKDHVLWKADFTKPGSFTKELEGLLIDIGALDGVVHCVGIRSRRPLPLFQLEGMQAVLNANVVSFVEIMRIITKRGYFNHGLSVVGLSSISAHVGSPGVTAYAASKAALESSIRCLAAELFKKSIRVNGLVCGQVNTEAYRELMSSKESDADPVLQRQYMGLLEVDQIVEAICYLLGGSSSQMNGTMFPAHAGFLS